MILFSRDGDAISFNDESSPHSHATGGTKVCINGQVNRALSVEWFYKLLALFPDIPGELKSARIIAGFNKLPTESRNSIWRSLRRVQIHIVDARWFYRVIAMRRPGFIELESKGSHYIQAADFAAGIASDIYASHKLTGVVERFEYVTFNGERVSLSDAEEHVRKEKAE